MSKVATNTEIYRAIVNLVVERLCGGRSCMENTKAGPLVTNYFSFTFPVTVSDGNKSHKVFVKIPKEDLRRRPKTILPITETERRMAENEVKSLQMLAEGWESEDLKVSWVRLLEFIPQYNAIITDAVDATDALAVFRRMELQGRFGIKEGQIRLRNAMARLGEALGRFHQKNCQKKVFCMNETLPKLERYCRELQAMTRINFPDRVMEQLLKFAGFEVETLEVQTLKGIDIRNVLMDATGRMFLLDPGPIKRTCREADLARFIMTYRILYWGSKLFLLGLQPDLQAEEEFLKAYYSSTAPRNSMLLSLYLIKEQLKHWHTALESLNLLPWPKALKSLIAATYINRYYTRQLAAELAKVV